MALPSLSFAYVRTGDVLYTPMGFLSAEKAINDNSLAIRINFLVFMDSGLRSFRLVTEQEHRFGS